MTEWELEQIFGLVDKLILIYEGIKKNFIFKLQGEFIIKNYCIKLKIGIVEIERFFCYILYGLFIFVLCQYVGN